MSTTLKLTILTISTLLITACNNTNGKGKQNSQHGLINTPPKAQTQSINTDEDTNIDITLKAIDDDNDTIGYRVSHKPTHGKLKGKAPNLTYTPNKDYNGKDSFAFIANDGQADSNEATIDITVNQVNDKPIATDDQATLDEDTNITINPLENDTDVDIATNDDKLTITEITNPSNGKATLKDNTITYIPNPNYNGSDSLEYTIKDKEGASSIATVDITINPVNDGPVAKDDNATTPQGKALTIDVLSDDSDVDGDNLAIKSAKAKNGKVEIKDNKLLYTPNKTFFGKEEINYTIQDTHNATSIAKAIVDVQEHPYITKLELSLQESEVNKDTTFTPTITATYSNNTTKEIDKNIEWIITPKDAIETNNNTLKAIKDTNVALQAKVTNFTGDTILSNKANLSIYWEVRGHRLPPEPDPKINNSTLLGIDSNNNGVRDDVERWIYEEYKDKHPIYIDIAMQAARGYKLVLEHPEKAKGIREKVNAALFCASYYEFEAQFFKDPILIHERIDSPVKSRYFDTKERKDIYWQYDTLLSGDSYALPEDDEMKSFCDFNTSKYDKE